MQTSLLVTQCTETLDRLEALQPKYSPQVQPLFAISGLTSDLQRLYAIYLILTDLTAATVQAEVAEAIGNLIETIGLTYPDCTKKRPVVKRNCL